MNSLPMQAVLVSVGGSPEPVLFALRNHRPKHVWYFCSEGSRPIADGIHSQLDWHPDRDFIDVVEYEELGACYGAVREAVPKLLKKWRVKPENVLVDYTGGTKTMSAALVLAAIEVFHNFSYIGGEKRQKGGLGITADGFEKALIQQNPWQQLAIREVQRACDLWTGCQYEAVAEVFAEVGRRDYRPEWFITLAQIAEGMAARHRLDFRKAIGKFAPARGKIRALCEAQGNQILISFVERSHQICNDCASDEGSSVLLGELLANAQRTAAQGRYEDAAARLYRAMELQAQLWLKELTGGAFSNGKLKPDAVLPPKLAELPFCKPPEDGQIKLTLEQLFLASSALGHEPSARIAADISLGSKSRLRAATEKRNTSILAHGVRPIGQEGFEQMKQIAIDFFRFDFDAPAHRVPQLDPAWF